MGAEEGCKGSCIQGCWAYGMNIQTLLRCAKLYSDLKSNLLRAVLGLHGRQLIPNVFCPAQVEVTTPTATHAPFTTPHWMRPNVPATMSDGAV